MEPVKKPDNITATEEARSLVRPKIPTASSTPLALSKPIKRTKPAVPTRATTADVSEVARNTSTNEKKAIASEETTTEEDALRKEAEAQARKLVEEEEAAAKPQEIAQPEPSPKTDTAPLGKLATRMKSLLRRNTNEKKKEKKSKPQQEFDRLEDAHWSEM
jgi:hypothetical protein